MNRPPLPPWFPPPAPPAQAYPLPYSYPVFYPPAPPRVWTVFVAFVIACVGGLVGAGMVAAVLAVVIHGPAVFDAGTTAGQNRLQAAMLEPPVFLPTLLATQVVLAGVAVGAGMLSPTP